MKVILLCIFLLFTSGIKAQESGDTQFWFVAPDASDKHSDNPTFLLIATGNEEATVTISMPADSEFEEQTRTIAPRSYWKYVFDENEAEYESKLSTIENAYTSSGTATNKGIFIKSTAKVSAYYQIDGLNQKEIFTFKGGKALGDDFYIPFQKAYGLSATYKLDGFRQIQIVATEDNTEVTLTATDSVAVEAKAIEKGKYIRTLQKGQTLLWRGAYQSSKLTGSRVQATKPIAVTMFEDCVEDSKQGSKDPIGDQLVPVNNLGKNYIVVKGYSSGNAKDHVGVLAVKNNTTVSISTDGRVLETKTLQTGEYWHRDLGYGEPATGSQGYYVQTSEPAYCIHQSAAGTEIGGALLPSLYSISSRQIMFRQTNMAINSLFLVFREGAKNSFKLNGTDLSLNPVMVGNIDGWMYAKYNIPSSASTPEVSVIENDKGAFSMGYFNGTTSSSSLYGYLSGFGNFSFSNKIIYHHGSSYTFDAPYALSYDWTLPDGTKATTANVVATKSGKYTLTVNQDPYIVTDETYLKLQNFKHKLLMPVGSAFINTSYELGVELNPQKDKDNYFDATYEWNFGDGATVSTANTAMAQNISWNTLGIKNITLKITNLNANCDTTITHKVLVTDLSDDLSDADCYIKPSSVAWKPILKNTSTSYVHAFAQPLVGDIDNDGNIETVTINRTSDSILVFDKSLSLKKPFKTSLINANGLNPMALARMKSSDNNALILIATADKKLEAYKSDGTLVWTSSASIFNDGTSSIQTASVSLVVGDLNNDGIPEVFAGDRLFNATDGTLIASLPNGSGNGRGYGILDNTTNAYMPVMADVDSDGQLEIVGGNTTYKLKGNALEVLTHAVGLSDGFASVADVDLDGQLDVVVVNSNETIPSLTVWNGATGALIAGTKSPSSNGVGGSRVAIGNIDDDKYPELFLSYEKKIVAFKYVPQATTVQAKLKEIWSTTTTTSGSAGISMFDFDQDGKVELVYQDGTNLRIIDGSTGKDKATYKNYFSPRSASPVVVDIDQDKHADILIIGAESEAEASTKVRVKRLSGEMNDWAPARSVWNQYAYSPTSVNNDLTIPQYQINASTTLSGVDGTLGSEDDIRPYNSFLQQQTSLSKKGIPLYLAPEAKIVNAEKIRFDYDMKSGLLSINNLEISNVGDADLQAPIKITVYANVIPSEHQYTFDYNNTISVGNTDILNIQISKFNEWLPVNNIIIRINDGGNGVSYQAVCDACCTTNTSDAFANIPFDKLAWADSYRKCVGEDVTFDAYSFLGNNVSYQWFTPSNDLLGNTRIIKNNNLLLSNAGQYIFRADNVNNQLSIKYTLPYLSVAPPTLYWRTDAIDNNWNNLNNWSTSSLSQDAIMAIPSGCTKVYIPSVSNNYPSLDTQTTDYSLYGNPTVGNIVFEYGAELAYQHKLIYNKAYIQYNWGYYNDLTKAKFGDQPLEGLYATTNKRNSWYMLAAPLKKMVSGDFSFAGKPLTWQAQFNSTNPTNEELVEGDFSKPYSTNDIDLGLTNNALAIKVAAYGNSVGTKEQNNLEGLKGILEIPFFEKVGNDGYHQSFSYDSLSQENKLFYFDTQTLQRINYPVGKVMRGDEAYRFIYETESNEVPLITVGSQTLPGYKKTVTIGASGSSKLMIGNPFLSSINAETFFNSNSSVLNNEGYYVFSNETQTWTLKTYTADNNIPPYEAFLITLANNLKTADLLFPLETDLLPSTRSTSMLSTSALHLQLKNSENVSADYAVLNSGIEEKADVNKILFPEGHLTPEAFFVSTEGKGYNLIQAFKNGISEIGIGVKSSDAKNQMTLSFENTQEFLDQNKVQLILVDKLLKKEQDINSNATYSFRQEASNLTEQYVDKSRFALRVVYATSGTEIETRSEIEILYLQNRLTIESSNQIDQVYLYDLYGRLLHSDRKIGLNSYSKEYNLPKGAYVVKVITESGTSHVAKVLSL